MPDLDYSGLTVFDDILAELLEKAPEERRALHEQLGELAKQQVDAAIGQSGVDDSRGRVRRWQVKHIGSRGGYAAVRPAGSKEGEASGPDGAAAITNYLEGGHKIRSPKTQREGYTPRIRVSYVSGHHFYDSSRSSLEAAANREVERFAETLAQKLEAGR